MLDASDEETVFAIRELTEALGRDSPKPLVLWVGAGISAWCGYPLWGAFAEQTYTEYIRLEKRFDKSAALEALNRGDFPAFFQCCKDANPRRFFRIVADTFRLRPPSPMFNSFLKAVNDLNPQGILTTNVDELLEHALARPALQRADFELCVEHLARRESFLCKLHGSNSAVESTVFSTSDYSDLLSSASYTALLRAVFQGSSVLFVGTSLGDRYVIDSLFAADADKKIFGDGPHFLVSPKAVTGLPPSIRVIRYMANSTTEHRGVVYALNLAGSAVSKAIPVARESLPVVRKESIYYISDFMPPGTWSTSQTLSVDPMGDAPNGSAHEILTGQGFVSAEMPRLVSTALHDLLVGLLCFDKVLLNAESVGKLVSLVGEALFDELLDAGSVGFVFHKTETGVVYKSREVAGGHISPLQILPDGKSEWLAEWIRRQINSVRPGAATGLRIQRVIERTTHDEDSSDCSVVQLTHGTLLHPAVRKLLGLSDLLSVSSVPRWSAFPVLRVTEVTRVARICRRLGVSATKMPFGASKLAAAAFGVVESGEWCDAVASYVMAGKFDTNLAVVAQRSPSIIDAVLRFRESTEGSRLRAALMNQLAKHEGTEFIASVNARISSLVPAQLLEAARSRFQGLLLAPVTDGFPGAFGSDDDLSQEAVRRWREHSLQQYRQVCTSQRLGPYDPCPCGSGAKIKFCCDEALSNNR